MQRRTLTATRVRAGRARTLLGRPNRHGFPFTGADTGALRSRAHARHARRVRAGDLLPLALPLLFFALTRPKRLPPCALRLGARTHICTLPAPFDHLGIVLASPCLLFLGRDGDGGCGRG